MKKGVSMIVLVLTVVVMTILITTTTISVINVNEKTEKIRFGDELMLVQEWVSLYKVENGKYPIRENMIDIEVANNDLSQFSGETVNSGVVSLNEVNLDLFGNIEVKYGTGSANPKDKYVVSTKTGRVYYADGLKVGDMRYYTLTEDLKELIGYNDSNVKGMTKDGIIFTPSTTEWTNEGVSVQISIPLEYTIVSVKQKYGTTNTNITNKQVKDQYNIYTTATTKANFEVIVEYKKDGSQEQQTQVFNIANYDSQGPQIKVRAQQNLNSNAEGSESKSYIKIEELTDNISGVKETKYEYGRISDPSYFKDKGIIVNNNVVMIEKEYDAISICSFDNAGNVTLIQVTVQIPEQGTKVKENVAYNKPYIPDNFTHIEGTVNTGYVIQENDTKNEFVWIPVKDINEYIRRYDTSNLATETLDKVEYESVKKYGGFYVARYEAGVSTVDGDREGVPVSKKGATVWTNISASMAMYNSKLMYKDRSDIESRIISSYMWDTIANWFEQSGYDIENLSRYGNVNNPGGMKLAGSNENWKINNIYDIVGNVWEFTSEKLVTGGNNNYTYRGFSTQDSYLNMVDRGRDQSFAKSLYISFRTALLIK